MADISTITNISSPVIKQAEKIFSTVTNPVAQTDPEGNTFSQLLDMAINNINTTNAYLSDQENAEVEWSLGQTENAHDLTIALQKGSTALQYTVAIRDRVLAAYNQIMQMQF